MVNEGFIIIDRSQLDRIRLEQNFQLSGVVDDETAVSIGKVVGANIIITGSVTGTDSTRRLRLRALNTQTAQVMAVASERL
jgi:curli biogenesis system outer membrane secretion channel CsgG